MFDSQHTMSTMCIRAGCRAYNREREAAAQRRRAAEADAYARSRKILEEELARDRAWRDAVKQVRSPECGPVRRSVGQWCSAVPAATGHSVNQTRVVAWDPATGDALLTTAC